ncbi:MAG: elongation factor G [candidate division Zixibacteria bacterium]|nr:elongation factor G [Candidatus Tariuqbacter arcticus]
MSAIAADKIRNIALVGHGGSGKTTLAESIMYKMGTTTRMGTIEAGNTISDYRPAEVDRQISISSTLMTGDYQGFRLNIVDTPGFNDFIAEARGPIRVADAAVVVLSGLNGVEVGTEQVWGFADELNRARIIVINGLDRENARFDEVLQDAKNEFGNKVAALQFPVNQGDGFNQIIDLLKMKLLKFDREGKGDYTEEEIPPEFADKAADMHQIILENAAEADDDLLEIYFDDGDLTQEQFEQGLRTGISKGSIVPVLCAAASANIGSKRLLETILSLLPNPAEVEPEKGVKPGTTEKIEIQSDKAVALTWKTLSEAHVGELSLIRVFSGAVESGSELFNTTTGKSEKAGQIFHLTGKERRQVNSLSAGEMGAVVKLKNTHTGDTLSDSKHKVVLPGIKFPEPVMRTAVVPKSKGDEDKISTGLQSIHEEDPSFVAAYDPELQQTIIAGQGEFHLDVIIERLKDKFGVEVEREDPKIPYRETIRGTAEAEGKHKKQSGGRGQFGIANLKLEPMPRGEDFEFVNSIYGGAIPSKYIPAVEKGIREKMAKGVVAGYKVVDVKVTLYDGKFHEVDSSELAFKIAGSLGFANAFAKCKPMILEPIYDIEVRVPEAFMGDVMGDISSRRGKIQGMEAAGKMQVIKAKVPLGELNKYSTALRSMTQGRGVHRQKLSHYEEVPGDIQANLIEIYQKARAEGSGG